MAASADYKNVWSQFKSLFTVQTTVVVLVVLSVILFLSTLCLLMVIVRLIKQKKRRNETSKQNKIDSIPTYLSSLNNVDLMTNQVQSTQDATVIKDTSHHHKMEPRASWNEKKLSDANDDDEVETVNEVLGMEERNGKIYYKVNFTGHKPDYTAWVCEEDLIPE